MPDSLDCDVRHRHGLPWYTAQVPRRWHSCRIQAIELHRANGLLIGICHCACGAFTDYTSRWVGRNSRKNTPDPAGLRRDPDTPQSARRHPRSYQTDQTVIQRRRHPSNS